jgi:hypothetical protein
MPFFRAGRCTLSLALRVVQSWCMLNPVGGKRRWLISLSFTIPYGIANSSRGKLVRVKMVRVTSKKLLGKTSRRPHSHLNRPLSHRRRDATKVTKVGLPKPLAAMRARQRRTTTVRQRPPSPSARALRPSLRAVNYSSCTHVLPGQVSHYAPPLYSTPSNYHITQTPCPLPPPSPPPRRF